MKNTKNARVGQTRGKTALTIPAVIIAIIACIGAFAVNTSPPGRIAGELSLRKLSDHQGIGATSWQHQPIARISNGSSTPSFNAGFVEVGPQAIAPNTTVAVTNSPPGLTVAAVANVIQKEYTAAGPKTSTMNTAPPTWTTTTHLAIAAMVPVDYRQQGFNPNNAKTADKTAT